MPIQMQNTVSHVPRSREEGAARRAGAPPERPLHPSYRPRLLDLLPYIALLYAAFRVFVISFDDSFITFRYAANVLAGHGPVFNAGERVEGFSSPLHLAACVALMKAAPSVGMLFKAKLFSLICAIVALHQMRPLALRFGLSVPEARIAQLLLVSNINFAILSVNGLETTMYMALILWAAVRFIDEWRAGRGWSSAIILFVAMLARPDAILVFAFLAALRLGSNCRRRGDFLAALRWAFAFAAPTALLLAARIAYYGDILPNTYYAKNAPALQALGPGLDYLLMCAHTIDVHGIAHMAFLKIIVFVIMVAIVFWVLAAIGLVAAGRSRASLVGAVVIAAAIVFVLRAGGDWMLGWRFMAAALPFLAIYQMLGIRCVAARLASGGARPDRPVRARAVRAFPYAAAFAAMGAGTMSHAMPWSAVRFSTADADLVGNGHPYGLMWLGLAQHYRRDLPRGAYVATSEMGYGPYCNPDKRFLDVHGLTNRQIARVPAFYKGTAGVGGTSIGNPGKYWHSTLLTRTLVRERPDEITSFYPIQNGDSAFSRRYAMTELPYPMPPTWASHMQHHPTERRKIFSYSPGGLLGRAAASHYPFDGAATVTRDARAFADNRSK